MIRVSGVSALNASIFAVPGLKIFNLRAIKIIGCGAGCILVLMYEEMMSGFNTVDGVANSLMLVVVMIVLPFGSFLWQFGAWVEFYVLEDNWLFACWVWSDLVLLLNYDDVMIFNAADIGGTGFAGGWGRLIEDLTCFYVCDELLDILFIVTWGFTFDVGFLLDVW